jgi:RNA ligase (TIGR02306 family)
MTERKLATVETIVEVAPIDGADAIERVRVRGWDVVVKKGEFAVGGACVYFEVDSMLDVTDPRFAFLAPRGVRTDPEGRSGHVLRTAKLRGQYSQGLALPLSSFPEVDQTPPAGTDVTDILGVVKWDPPLPASLSGQVRGVRPSWIPVTDEERIQNLPTEILTAAPGAAWTPTEKIDGSSVTFWSDPDSDPTFGVCSRNLDLLDVGGNTLWELARSTGAIEWLGTLFPGRRVALQGEAFGEGIQGNRLKVRGHHFAAFTLRVDGSEVPRGSWPEAVASRSVPILDLPFPASVEEGIAQVDKIRSRISPDRLAEGVVWRCSSMPSLTLPDGRIFRASFKIVSNAYLLKHGD